MVERIKTGLPGLDDLIQGGLKKGSITLLSGPTGTFKTIFASQYVYNGAKNHGDVGAYLTLEERADGIRQSLSSFGMDTQELEKSGKLHLVDLSGMRKKKPEYGEDKKQYTVTVDVLIKSIKNLVKKNKLDRLVIDSVSILGLLYKDPAEMRDDLFIFTEFLRSLDVTVLLITEVEEEFKDKKVSRFGLEEFLADAVIVLGYTRSKGELRRWVSVRKMRFTDHDLDMHPIRLTGKGVEILSSEKTY